jgi:hypothetical protein
MASFVYNRNKSVQKQFWRPLQHLQDPKALEQCQVQVLEWSESLSARYAKMFELTTPSKMLRQTERLSPTYSQIHKTPRDVSESRQKALSSPNLISLAPLDVYDQRYPEEFQGLEALYKQFGIPTEFTLERVQSATHGCGSHSTGNDYGIGVYCDFARVLREV